MRWLAAGRHAGASAAQRHDAARSASRQRLHAMRCGCLVIVLHPAAEAAQPPRPSIDSGPVYALLIDSQQADLARAGNKIWLY
jgi:hypothetical protein